jgi:hypothetical protein
MTTRTLPLADLVEDLAVYPRHAVDESNVGRLARALAAGETLPPPVADAQSLRIVDGWHRVRAYRRVLGPTASIDVELRRFKNEEELILTAIALNASHGRQLDKSDQVRCVRLAQAHGITLSRIAHVLHRPEADMQKLAVRVAMVPVGTEGAIPGTNVMAMKRPVFHLAGQTLTREQAEAQASVPGTSYRLIARQLIDALRLNLANRHDEGLQLTLRELRDVLVRYLE